MHVLPIPSNCQQDVNMNNARIRRTYDENGWWRCRRYVGWELGEAGRAGRETAILSRGGGHGVTFAGAHSLGVALSGAHGGVPRRAPTSCRRGREGSTGGPHRLTDDWSRIEVHAGL